MTEMDAELAGARRELRRMALMRAEENDLHRQQLATIRELLPDPNKLHVLAQWIDLDDSRRGRCRMGVQDDLRRWSTNADRAAEIIRGMIGDA